MTRGSRLRLLITATIGGALVYYVCRRIDLRLTLDAIAAARLSYLLAGFGLMVTAYLVRAARWLIWDRPFGYHDSLKAILVGFMGNNLLPARLGEFLRADWTAARSSADFGRTSAIASIAAERILDGIVLSALALIGVLLVEVDRLILLGLLAVAAAFACLTLVLIFTIARDSSIRSLLDRVNRFFPGHLTTFGKTNANYALDGLARLRGGFRLPSAIAITALIWGLEVAFYWAVGRAIFPISIATSMVFLAVVNFVSLFPFTIGGIGTIEGAATAFLITAGVPSHEAFAMVLVQHGFQFLFTTVLGAAVYLSDHRVRARRPTDASAVAEPESAEDVLARTRLTLDSLRSTIALEKPADRRVSLSIVIPAYNERNRLPRTLLETIRWCNLNAPAYEILVVDDGSTDDTLAIAELLAESDRNVRWLACPHRGKGAAVRIGMLNARGQYVLFMDADGATSLADIQTLLVEMKKGRDVAIGSRVSQRPGDVTVETSLHRKLIGRVFALFVNLFAVSGIADSQCGFKMFRREIVKTVFSRQKLDGFAFDVEILFIAKQLALSVVEVPVNWRNQPGSKVSVVVDSMKMLADLTRIRWIHRTDLALAPELRRVGAARVRA
jgi:dolichyl-phosphate beta-glucosyltransferase